MAKSKFLLVLFIILGLVLRLPSLFEPYWNSDEGVYLAVGQAIRRGLSAYEDVYDNKPPLLHLLAAISPEQLHFRILSSIFVLLSLLVFFKICQKLLVNKAISSILIIYLLLTNLPLLEGNTGNAEMFFQLTSLVGIYLWARGSTTSSVQKLSLGLIFGIGFLFKFHAVFDLAPLVVYILLFQPDSFFKSLRERFYDVFIIIVGFSLPFIASLIPYYFYGTINYYLDAAFIGNLDYATRWGNSPTIIMEKLSPITLAGRSILLVVVTSLLFLFKKRISKTEALVFLWFSFSLFSVLLSGRPYPHYIYQLVPSLCLVIFILFKGERFSRFFAATFLGLLLVSVIKFNFYVYPVLGYYRNFYLWITNQRSATDYINHFNWNDSRNVEIANYIKKNSSPDDKIYLAGDQPVIYALSDRRPAGSYLYQYQVFDFGKTDDLLTAFRSAPPKVIVIFLEEERFWEGFEDLLASKYVLATSIGNALIYSIPAK